jgi:NAD(P)-dependent dehydrogenase (short-subunit alcohol dehydrogenase family)
VTLSTPPLGQRTDASLAGRRVLVTGDTALPHAVAEALEAYGARVVRLRSGFGSEKAVQDAVAIAEQDLGGLDQVVHAWLPANVLTFGDFMSLDEDAWQDGCEAAMSGAWWLTREAIPPLQRTRGALTFLIPTVGMSGAAGFSMLASVAEGIRVLAKGVGRQLGSEGVTINSIATAAHLWIPPDDAATVTGATTLAKAAFGRSGDAAADIAPIVALLGQPQAHFVTAGTVVADGGIWMGL